MRITFDYEKIAAFANNLKQADLAEKFGVRQQTISHRIKNIENIRLRDFAVICEMLKKNPDYFYDVSE